MPLLELTATSTVLVALAMTHATIAAASIYLHRHQAHRALDLHPLVSHLLRLWLWLTTGMKTREWVAVHRKHHVASDTVRDPHSPQVLGLGRVLWLGALLYQRAAGDAETVKQYGRGTPADWLERHVYEPLSHLGIFIMLMLDVGLFGLPGLIVWMVQMLWVPFWAAGVLNGLGHSWGYRNYRRTDAARNIVPWGILLGGEELHNNHHAHPGRAKFSRRWWEIDIGWAYIRTLECLGLAQRRRKGLHPF
ncbi:MAG: DesA family fatty acid desaturase [Gammaproteobacteria bacterium]